MSTRTRTVWKPRDDGQFDCRVGWTLNASRKREQPRFRLGSDVKEAQRRDQLLRLVWERIEASNGKEALWGDDMLELAKSVAKGTSPLHVARFAEEDVVSYVHRVMQLCKAYPMLAILPERDYGAAFGYKMLATLEESSKEIEAKLDDELERDRVAFQRKLGEVPAQQPITNGPGLHAALEAYIVWLGKECENPDGTVSNWGQIQIRFTKSLIAHHHDVPLAILGRNEVEAMLGYWRKRPLRRGSKQRVSKKSSSHFIGLLKSFFKWLHNSNEFKWRKPEGFEDLKTKVMTLDAERAWQVQAEHIFSLDELKLLYRYGTPMDRLLILLALNCGFAAAESSSLTVGEIFLGIPHTPRQREMLAVPLLDDDSFIKRVRRKSGVYGEFLLFAETVKGLEWASRERKKHGKPKPDDRLLLNGNGEPLDKRTSGGNSNKQIPNRFARLLKRIKADKHNITQLPVKMLRKTGGDIVKRFSDGEVSGVFLCHGQPVKSDELSDVYTRRPFGKLFSVLRKVEEYLAPVFAEGGKKPFGGIRTS